MNMHKRSATMLLALTDQGVMSAANFLTLLIVARKLSPEEFGNFSLAWLATLFLANLHRAVLTQPLNILGAGEKTDDLRRRLGNLLRIQAAGIPVLVSLMCALALGFEFEPSRVFSAAAYVACFFLQETMRRYWYTKGRLERALISDLMSYGGQLAALLALEHFDALTAPTIFLALAGTSLLAFILDSREVRAAMRPLRGWPALSPAHQAMSKWLILTVIAVWGASQVYPLLLSPLGVAAVASYAVCRNLLSVINVVIQSIGSYLPVRAAALLGAGGKDALGHHLRSTLWLGSGAGALFLAVALPFAEPLLHILYAGRYDGMTHVLRILSIGACFGVAGTLLGSYSIAMGDTRASFVANCGGSFFTFTAGIWLIHAQGVAGAALASSMSLALSAMIQGTLVFRRLSAASESRFDEPGARPLSGAMPWK